MGSLGAFTTNRTFLNDVINTYTADHLVQILDKLMLCLFKKWKYLIIRISQNWTTRCPTWQLFLTPNWN